MTRYTPPAAAPAAAPLDLDRSATGETVIAARVDGDTEPRWKMDPAGAMYWGGGSSTPTKLLETAAAGGYLRIPNGSGMRISSGMIVGSLGSQSGRLHASSTSASDITFVAKGDAGQTADLTQWRDSDDNVGMAVAPDRRFRWFADAEQTTVGAAGAASAPPATPSKYLQIQDSTGTVYVVPAYAVS